MDRGTAAGNYLAGLWSRAKGSWGPAQSVRPALVPPERTQVFSVVRVHNQIQIATS